MKLRRVVPHPILNQLRLCRDRFVLERIAVQSGAEHIDPRALIRVNRGCELRLGKNVKINAFTIISVETDPLVLQPQRTFLEIGDRTYIGELSNIRAAGVTTIGKDCLIAQGVSIIASNHSMELGERLNQQVWRTDKIGVTIEDNVWIGTNSTILPGVTVGSGSIVAAGSVVTTNVARDSIVAGVPAKVIKMRR